MLFPTIDFALFFLLVFAVAWSGPALARPWVRKSALLIASAAFYGWWDWRFLGLLALSAHIAWAAGHWMARAESERARRWILGGAVAANLAILGFFKYYGFFVEELGAMLAQAGLERDLPLFEIILPVGISFFTFQSLSYIVDLKRGRLERPAGWLDMMLYISFFPQLVAGPIVRASAFLPQLAQTPRLTRRAVALGGVLIALGLFKKMVVAHHLAVSVVDPVFLEPDYYGSWRVALAVYAYAVQIYCDFSGYSDIAIGVAALLGYRFSKNFDRPYAARSLQDFWRRWHISLSSWLRDYLYVSLGGNRGGEAKTYRNLFATMLLGGLWHGAAWTFLAWGALHGAGLAIERWARGRLVSGRLVWGRLARGGGGAALAGLRRFLAPEPVAAFAPVERDGPLLPPPVARALSILVVFHIVCAAWVLFRASDWATAMAVFETLAALRPAEEPPVAPWLIALVVGALALQQIDLRRFTVRLRRTLAAQPAFVWGVAFGGFLLLNAALSPEGVAPFIYFQF